MDSNVMYKKLLMPVQTKDVDVNDNVRPASILDYFQDVAGIHADILGLGAKTLMDEGLLWIIISERYDVIKRVPFYGEEIYLVTWPKNQGKVFIEREYEIRDKDFNLLITGISSWVLINKDTRKLERASKICFNGTFYDKNNYIEPPVRKFNLVPNNIINEYDYKVVLTDYDHNKHVNNARYLDMIYNMYNKDYNYLYKYVEIAFIHEVLQDDIIHIVHFKEGIYDCFIGYKDDIVSFEVKMILEEI